MVASDPSAPKSTADPPFTPPHLLVSSASAPHAPASSGSELLTIERVAILHRVRLFSGVPGHTLIGVARLLEERRVEAGVSVIDRGAIEDWLFVIAEGRLRVHVGERTLGEVGAGEVVGELAVLAPAPRSASVTATEPTLLLALRRAPFEELLDDHPEISRAIISTLARLLQAAADDGASAPGR